MSAPVRVCSNQSPPTNFKLERHTTRWNIRIYKHDLIQEYAGITYILY